MSEQEKQAVQLTDGNPVPADRSHEKLKENGQQEGYVVLAPEERAKGFVRPVRTSYQHVGRPGPKYPLRDLTEEQKKENKDFNYVKYEEYPPSDSPLVGRYWTQAMLDRIDKGCRSVTSMGRALAETYARDPKFYSGTFCANCGKHFPVGEDGEFVWTGTEQRVGT